MKILSLFVLVASVLLLAGCTAEKVPAQPTEPVNIEIPPSQEGQKEAVAGQNESITSAINQSEATTATKDELKLVEDKCGESANLGYLSCVPQDKDIVVKIVNAGRGDINGIFYRFIDASQNVIGEYPEMGEIKIGYDKELAIKTSNYPYTKYVHIFPVQAGKICGNKQLVVIPSTNCR